MMIARRRQGSLYARDLPQISLANAEEEPETDRLFIDSSKPFPQIVLKTSVMMDGFAFDVTLNDMSLSDAAAILRRRGCTPVAPPSTVPAPAPTAPAVAVVESSALVAIAEPAPAAAPAVEPPVARSEAPAKSATPAVRVVSDKMRMARARAMYAHTEYAQRRKERGIWLRDRRLELGLSQRRLEQLCGLKPTRVSSIESASTGASEKVWAHIEQVVKELIAEKAAQEGGGTTPF